ncbi:MAG: glycoside hydrolase family 32 protein [Bacteroidetes bacterium]|nr:glycoside hydrolase family 32 protein [Bacteroidota bacterium]
MKYPALLFAFCFLLAKYSTAQNDNSSFYHEQYRPQIHFSPKQHWTNDPNGMVYYKGTYHLFFQYYPNTSEWGPMHWGHAISNDLVHWKELPIALYPDSLGYIFSGSAVVDSTNTSGFGKNGKIPLIAIFTHHDPKGEQEGKDDFQNQSIAYSLDDGMTWKKYSGNPVLKNPGIKDFRDPKVMWFAPQKKWVMTLATKDRVTFYSSPDFKHWKKESDFGSDIGAHGGVWECPDLFSLNDHGKKVWVLIGNIGSGTPNKGSGTQYFIGNFDGNKFIAVDNKTRWIDYGPDDYAGITWSNTGDRKIFLGWMANWLYANKVPTKIWRNAMTIPRELKIKHTSTGILVASEPVKELNSIIQKKNILENISVEKNTDLTEKIKVLSVPCKLDFSISDPTDFFIILSNDAGEELKIGYDKTNNYFFIDRTKSGKIDFQEDFSGKHVAPRFTDKKEMNLSLIMDVSSVELFADDGLSVMTETFFPSKKYSKIRVETPGKISIKKVGYSVLKSIW